MDDDFTLKLENELLKSRIKTLEYEAAVQVEYNKIRDKLLYILSHDVHSPLRFSTMVGKAVLGNQSTLSREELLDTFMDLNNTNVRILLLISNILKWIEFQKENFTVKYNVENLHTIIANKFDFFSLMAANKNIDLVNNIPENLFVNTDKNTLNIIIQNLINNALKFTSEGEIEASAIINEAKNEIRLSISDTGQGMSPEYINNIKSNNTQCPLPDTENMIGNGLGWGLIKELLAYLHGSFDIYSKNRMGTTVTLILPMNINS